MTKIERSDGTVLYEEEHTQEKILEPEVANTISTILPGVIASGTGTDGEHRSAPRPARPAPPTTTSTPGSAATPGSWRRRCGSGSPPAGPTAIG